MIMLIDWLFLKTRLGHKQALLAFAFVSRHKVTVVHAFPGTRVQRVTEIEVTCLVAVQSLQAWMTKIQLL